MQIGITVTGLDRVNERLDKLGASLHDFSGALATLGAMLIRFYGDTVFTSRGTAIGERWEPLADSTDRQKALHWPGRDILERTGAMKAGFEAESTSDSLRISNRVPYFPYHQLGTGIGGGQSGVTFKLGSLARSYSIGGMGRGRNLPARPMLGINDRVESMIKTVLEADVRKKIETTNL